MKIQEPTPQAAGHGSEGGVCVVIVNAGGLHELCDVHEVRDQHGNAQLAGQAAADAPATLA